MRFIDIDIDKYRNVPCFKLWHWTINQIIIFIYSVVIFYIMRLSATVRVLSNNLCIVCFQANLAVQEARYEAAMKDLNKAQDQLDEKEKELEAVQAQYDQAMSEKQVTAFLYVSRCRGVTRVAMDKFHRSSDRLIV